MTSNLLQGVPKLSRWTLTVTCTEKFLDIVHLVLIITQLWDFSASILGMKEKKLYETRFCTATTIRILGHFQCCCVGF